MTEQQTAERLAQVQRCPRCGRPRPCKGHHRTVFRTPFGKLTLDSPPLYRCGCESRPRESFNWGDQRRWSARGAHRVPQVRAAILDGRLHLETPPAIT